MQGALPRAQPSVWLALVLGWVAGFADVFGYLVLDRIFTSHISGNSVAAGAAAAQADWTMAEKHAWPILFFAIGSFAGAAIVTACARNQWRRTLGAGLLLELALLVTFFVCGHAWMHAHTGLQNSPGRFYLLVALLASAMGAQTSSLRQVKGQSVNTTFVTGMMAHAVDNAVKFIFALYDRLRGRPSDDPGHHLGQSLLYVAVWLSFLTGGVCGGIGEPRWSFNVFLAPITVLALVIVSDLIHPQE